MGKIKKGFIKANLIMIGFFAALMLIFSMGTDNGIMVFIFGMCIVYSICWTIGYLLVFGTIADIINYFKE